MIIKFCILFVMSQGGREMDKRFILDFELVPDGCWYSNLRTILSKKQWDFIRSDAKERANHKCAICGKKVKRLEAHERWSYDEKNCVQKLEDVIAVCHDCHSVIHMGRTQLVGDVVRAEKHFMKVNECSFSQFRQRLGEVNEMHNRRNKVSEWALDITWLNRFIME